MTACAAATQPQGAGLAPCQIANWMTLGQGDEVEFSHRRRLDWDGSLWVSDLCSWSSNGANRGGSGAG